MTGRQQQAARQWIAERCGQGGREMTCPACGRTGGKWGVGENMVCLPIWSQGRMDIGTAILAVAMTCTQCGHMLLFCASEMGIL